MAATSALSVNPHVASLGPGPSNKPSVLALLCLVAAASGASLGAFVGGSAERHEAERRELIDARAARASSEQLEQRLQLDLTQLQQLERSGVLQEGRDLREAASLGLLAALAADLARMAPDDARRVLAALVREARRNGLDPLLLAAVIRVETAFNPYAVSDAGARGLMQLMPSTAIALAAQQGARVTAGQLFNAPLNIELGAAYLRGLLDRFGDVRSALVAYNAGPTVARAVRREAGVRGYPRRVLAEYSRLTLQARGAAARAAGCEAAATHALYRPAPDAAR